MKKIYIFAAVLALLTLSLNAQMATQKKVAQSSTEKVDIPFEGKKKISNLPNRAPKRDGETTYYQKVTSTSDLTNGEYLIVSEDQNVILNGSLAGSDLSGSNYSSVSINDGIIEYTTDLDAMDFTIDMTHGYIQSASGYYIGCESGNNTISQSQSTQYTNTISVDGNGVASIIYKYNNANRPLKCNTTNKVFRYYKTTSGNVADIQLYKKVESTPPTPTAELTAPVSGSTVNVGTNTGSGVSKAINIKGSNLTQDLTVSVTGTGFNVSRNSVTVTAAEANAGKDVTVTYDGTEANATGTLTITSSSEVNTTVNLTASYNAGGQTPEPEIGTLNVFIDTTTYVAEVLPVYGYYHDCTQHNQMIYPASMLTDMVGTKIKSMTFYPATYSSYSGINFRNGTVTFKMIEINGSTGFDGDNPSFITGTMETVKTVSMPSSANTSATTWLIEFDQEYEYNGGDLVIDVTTTTGNYAHTYFYIGTTESLGVEYPGFVNYSGSYNGSSVADFIPAVTFTYEEDVERTPAPVITADTTATSVIITATGDGTVTLTVGQQTETGTGSASITIPRGNTDQTVTATATAQDGTLAESKPTTEQIGVPALPKTPTPTITYQVVGNDMVITATGQGTVNLSVTGGYSATGDGTASVTIPLGLDEQTVTATATAQQPNYQVSDPATQSITIPEAGRSPQPTITFTDNGDGSYTITVTGTGEVAVYIEDAEHAGAPIATADGTFSFNVEQHSQAMTITVSATNQEEGLEVSRPVTETYPIPAMTIDGTFQTLDPQPANASTPIDLSKVMFVDRFRKVIPFENNHPRLYDYYLQETQVRQRTSNSVEVEVKHTGSDGLGFYSLNQIDNDTVRTLVMDVRNAAMEMALESDPGIYYYYGSRSTVAYPDQADRKYLGVLQHTTDDYYTETLNPSYDYQQSYPGGTPHIHLDTDTILGEYNDYLMYVPQVMTMGFDRVLYETDHLHNSYGAPKWKTGVGDVYINSVDVERQTNSASVTWNDNGQTSMYLMTIDATGVMPTVNTMPYEPYMFRVFVESKNGKLRNWRWVPEDTVNHVGSHFEAAPGTTTGPICVWSEYVKDSVNVTFNGDQINFVKEKAEDYDDANHWLTPGEMNILFAALDDMNTTVDQNNNEWIIDDDLKIFVRFYYIVKGSADGHTPVVHGQRPRDGEGDAPAGYGSESPGTPPSPSTGVKEVQYYGDVVSTTYYNVQGMTSDKPFNGINIVVVRYSNGTTRTFKVVR